MDEPCVSSAEQKRLEYNRKRREAYAKKKQTLAISSTSTLSTRLCQPPHTLASEEEANLTYNAHRRATYSANEENRNNLNKRRREAYVKNIMHKKKFVEPMSVDISYPTGAITASHAQQSMHFVASLEPPTAPFSLSPVPSCKWCGAMKFEFETKNFCCMDGQVMLTLHSFPDDLCQLYTSEDAFSSQFRNLVRTYNDSFSFTSFGVKYDKDLCRRNKGIYTFRVQGQIYHFINDLLPTTNPMSHLQLYFYDTEHEIENRIRSCDRLDRTIVSKLVDMLVDNPYSYFFRSLQAVKDLESHNIVLHSTPIIDQRVYNEPSVSQVAAIWIENDDDDITIQRNIKVSLADGSSARIQHYFGCYDPLQYPLLFPKGEVGWHQGIFRTKRDEPFSHGVPLSSVSPCLFQDPTSLLSRETQVSNIKDKKEKCISPREYYAYKLQIRDPNHSMLLKTGRLLQQYVVDMYVKIESTKLDFIRNNQSKIRRDLYQGIVDSVAGGETEASNVGKRVVLPASFIGGPRDMKRRYMDAMCLVQRYGKPDIFLTMTCNPNWPEIKECLVPTEEAQNRPDLIARIFRCKLEHLKKDLIKRHIFGVVKAYTYVVEFQKRGLPHAHFLLIMTSGHKLKNPDLYDSIVCAELLDSNTHPHLFAMITKHMMHGPCGELNPANVCMKRSQCKNKYPKEFADATSCATDSYPIYRRRDNGLKAIVRGKCLDNRWVVPYNPFLLAKYNCHLNVEICSTIMAVKYLYKYIYKGHDRIYFQLRNEQTGEMILDEIDLYQSARWVSAPESVWRIYRFPLSEISPAVIDLQLHLENKHTITFSANSNLENVLNNDFQKCTMLTEFFRMNNENEVARKGQFLYKEFPEYFTWDSSKRTWFQRKQQVVIGRIVAANPAEGERYYLRLLLSHVRGPTSFHFLKSVDHDKKKSFREAALAMGFLHTDQMHEMCLQEAVCYSMPASLRRLFATILVFCAPNDPVDLFMKFEKPMSEDIKFQNHYHDASIRNFVLQDIERVLESMGKQLSEYQLDKFIVQIHLQVDLCREIQDEIALGTSNLDFDSISNLNPEQKIIFDTIMEHVLNSEPGAFFVDGPGGSGKTFLYKALLAAVRVNGDVALATASSGVAASILPGGRTAHSRFKLPIDSPSTTPCNISKQSGLAKLLRLAKLIVWDEAPMAPKQAIETLDLMLQDVCGSTNLFGGKIIVFGGDFRQVLPVVVRGTRKETIAASLACSFIWNSLKVFKLSTNMRAQSDPTFSSYLLRIGNGLEPMTSNNEIFIPTPMCILTNGNRKAVEALIAEVMPHPVAYNSHASLVLNSAILTPKNDSVDIINQLMLDSLPCKSYEYISIDETENPSDQGQYQDFMNSCNPPGLPSHVLRLKKNCPIMLLRNIDPPHGLCNGTRLICKDFEKNLICAEIAVGDHKGQIVFIPRIPLKPSDKQKYPIQFRRKQFPIKLCFAMTINKAQGQTLNCVGIYLPEPVFSHGQLYVAMSRATNSTSIKIAAECIGQKNKTKKTTKNIVYHEILALTGCL